MENNFGEVIVWRMVISFHTYTTNQTQDRSLISHWSIRNVQKISFIVNVPTISGGAVRDGNMMRRLAVELNIPFVTTIRGAKMEVAAIAAMMKGEMEPVRLQVNY